jgi:hypothetical protein
MVIKNQGEGIDFMLTFDSSLSQDIQSFDDCDEVIVYVYTNKHRPARFSDLVRDGYYSLLRVDADNRGGVVPAAFTRNMQVGDMYVDVMLKKGDSRSVEVTYKTGVHLDPSKIKEEV